MIKNPPYIEIIKDKSINEKLMVLCVICGQYTNHNTLSSIDVHKQNHFEDGNVIDSQETYQILKCFGYDFISFRENFCSSDNFDFDENNLPYYVETSNFYPDRKFITSDIQKNFDLLPLQLQVIYRETEAAINSSLFELASIGIRVMIESICKDNAAEGRNLEDKINQLLERRFISENESKMLHKLRRFANAYAHADKEKLSPTKSQLTLALKIIDHFIFVVYVCPSRAKISF